VTKVPTKVPKKGPTKTAKQSGKLTKKSKAATKENNAEAEMSIHWESEEQPSGQKQRKCPSQVSTSKKKPKEQKEGNDFVDLQAPLQSIPLHYGGTIEDPYPFSQVATMSPQARSKQRKVWADSFEKFIMANTAGCISTDQMRHSQVVETSRVTIKEISEWPLHPKAHDDLVKSSVEKGSNDHIFDLEHPDSITKNELLRALEEYRDKESDDHRVRPWQYELFHSIDFEDRPFLQSSTLDESYGVGGSHEFEAIIIYPDIFPQRSGLWTAQDAFIVDLDEKGEKWWTERRGENADDVASVLPLASALGAILTPHLHNGVTHVLTELVGGLGYIAACAGGKEHFVSYERGEAVISRLGALGILDTVKLVSPGWVRSQWRPRREYDAVSL